MPALPTVFSYDPAAPALAVRRLFRVGGILAVCAVAEVATAQQAEPGRSPFLPQGWEQQAQTATPRTAEATATEASYVFNGMIQIGSRTLFSIGNAQTGHALLLEMGQSSGGVQVLSYNAQGNSVSLSSGGRTEELTLRKSDGEPLVATGQGGSRGGASGSVRPGGSVGSSGVSDESRRARQIAWMEARRDRMNELIERSRTEASGAEGSGAVTVGAGNTATGTATASGSRSSANTMRSGAPTEGGQNGMPRSRRLRLQINP